MHVSIDEATARLPESIRAVENGEKQISPPPAERRNIQVGDEGCVKLLPGRDDPVDLDRFLQGDIVSEHFRGFRLKAIE